MATAVSLVSARHPRFARTLPVVAGASAAAIGLLALLGWALGSDALKTVVPGLIAMQPLTALCFILGGAALAAAARQTGSRWTWLAPAILILLISVQTLIEYMFDADFGTDRLFFADRVGRQPLAYGNPGRMAEPTAISFACIGVALLLARSRAGTVYSFCATAPLIAAAAVLLGYLFGVEPLGAVFAFTYVALHTAIALALLAVGLLALRPDVGWVRYMLGRSVGAAAARRLLPVVIGVPMAVAWLVFKGSEVGFYPPGFRLALTTTITIILLGALTLWASSHLNRIEAIQRTQQALRETERQLNAVLDNASVSIFLLDDQLCCIYINAAAEQLTGYSEEEIRGQRLHEIIHHKHPDRSDFPREECPLHLAFANREKIRCEDVFVHRDGFHYPVAVAASPIQDERGNTTGTIVEARNISERRRAEEHQKLLVGELNHRVKNTLAIVQAVAQQTFGRGQASPEARQAFDARLSAVAGAHSLLTRESWERASLGAVVEAALAGCGADPSRLEIEGPEVSLAPRTAVSLALAFHELGTNAMKYGALSNDDGAVEVRWSLHGPEDQRLRLQWTERGGPEVAPPGRRGFGSRMIERGLAAELGGTVNMDYRPEGLVSTIDAPLPRR